MCPSCPQKLHTLGRPLTCNSAAAVAGWRCKMASGASGQACHRSTIHDVAPSQSWDTFLQCTRACKWQLGGTWARNFSRRSAPLRPCHCFCMLSLSLLQDRPFEDVMQAYTTRHRAANSISYLKTAKLRKRRRNMMQLMGLSVADKNVMCAAGPMHRDTASCAPAVLLRLPPHRLAGVGGADLPPVLGAHGPVPPAADPLLVPRLLLLPPVLCGVHK